MPSAHSQHKGNHKGGGGRRPPPPLWRRPKAASFVLAVSTGHILVLRCKTCALLRAKTSALLRRKTCAVLRPLPKIRPDLSPARPDVSSDRNSKENVSKIYNFEKARFEDFLSKSISYASPRPTTTTKMTAVGFSCYGLFTKTIAFAACLQCVATLFMKSHFFILSLPRSLLIGFCLLC